MSSALCLLIILLPAVISAQVKGHAEITKAGPSDDIQERLKDFKDTSDLLLVPDTKNDSNVILMNGTALSDLVSRSSSLDNVSNNSLSNWNPKRTGRRIGGPANGGLGNAKNGTRGSPTDGDDDADNGGGEGKGDGKGTGDGKGKNGARADPDGDDDADNGDGKGKGDGKGTPDGHAKNGTRASPAASGSGNATKGTRAGSADGDDETDNGIGKGTDGGDGKNIHAGPTVGTTGNATNGTRDGPAAGGHGNATNGTRAGSADGIGNGTSGGNGTAGGNGTSGGNATAGGNTTSGGNGTNTTTPSVNITSLAAAGNGRDSLGSDQRLLSNQILLSRNRQYALRISPTCNLDVVRVADLTPVWSSNSSSSVAPCTLFMKKSGFLTLLDRNLHEVWKSDSNQGDETASLQLGDDGNMTITDQGWEDTWKTNPNWRRDHLNAGDVVSDPMPLISQNQVHSLHITESCQLSARKIGFPNPVWTVGPANSTNSTRSMNSNSPSMNLTSPSMNSTSPSLNSTSPHMNSTNSTRCSLSLDRHGVVSLRSDKGEVVWPNNYTSADIGDEPFLLKLLANGTLTLTTAQVPIWNLDAHGFAMLV